jgi:ABC-type lipoprotein export system ATPase subunit
VRAGAGARGRRRSQAESSTPVSRAPIIQLHEVTKTFAAARAVPVLDHLTLDFLEGEFTSLMGPSGSGKTTLLNLVAGLDVPDSGSVVVLGQRLAALRDRELSALRLHRIGFVFQEFNLLPELTVAENVSWPLEFARRPRAEVRRRAAEALEQVAVRGCEERYPAELSGGEQQRVAIARAIVHRPAILLADEPTGNLDSHTGEAILDLLRGLNVASGVTVVMVTHNVLAAAYGDRTLELRDGRILRDVRAAPPASLNLVRGER